MLTGLNVGVCARVVSTEYEPSTTTVTTTLSYASGAAWDGSSWEQRGRVAKGGFDSQTNPRGGAVGSECRDQLCSF